MKNIKIYGIAIVHPRMRAAQEKGYALTYFTDADMRKIMQRYDEDAEAFEADPANAGLKYGLPLCIDHAGAEETDDPASFEIPPEKVIGRTSSNFVIDSRGHLVAVMELDAMHPDVDDIVKDFTGAEGKRWGTSLLTSMDFFKDTYKVVPGSKRVFHVGITKNPDFGHNENPGEDGSWWDTWTVDEDVANKHLRERFMADGGAKSYATERTLAKLGFRNASPSGDQNLSFGQDSNSAPPSLVETVGAVATSVDVIMQDPTPAQTPIPTQTQPPQQQQNLAPSDMVASLFSSAEQGSQPQDLSDRLASMLESLTPEQRAGVLGKFQAPPATKPAEAEAPVPTETPEEVQSKLGTLIDSSEKTLEETPNIKLLSTYDNLLKKIEDFVTAKNINLFKANPEFLRKITDLKEKHSKLVKDETSFVSDVMRNINPTMDAEQIKTATETAMGIPAFQAFAAACRGTSSHKQLEATMAAKQAQAAAAATATTPFAAPKRTYGEYQQQQQQQQPKPQAPVAAKKDPWEAKFSLINELLLADPPAKQHHAAHGLPVRANGSSLPSEEEAALRKTAKDALRDSNLLRVHVVATKAVAAQAPPDERKIDLAFHYGLPWVDEILDVQQNDTDNTVFGIFDSRGNRQSHDPVLTGSFLQQYQHCKEDDVSAQMLNTAWNLMHSGNVPANGAATLMMYNNPSLNARWRTGAESRDGAKMYKPQGDVILDFTSKRR